MFDQLNYIIQSTNTVLVDNWFIMNIVATSQVVFTVTVYNRPLTLKQNLLQQYSHISIYILCIWGKMKKCTLHSIIYEGHCILKYRCALQNSFDSPYRNPTPRYCTIHVQVKLKKYKDCNLGTSLLYFTIILHYYISLLYFTIIFNHKLVIG